jgi:C4-dicarboxylate-specific signal transduction histidine kinase
VTGGKVCIKCYQNNKKGDFGVKKSAIIILGLCLALVLTVTGCGAKDDGARTDLRMGVSALTALADAHVTDYLDLLKDLAVTPEVRSADWQQMKDLLARQAQTRIAALIWFVLPDGSAYTADLGKTSQSLADRDYFSKLMAGNTVVGTLLVGKISGIKSYLVAVPVIKDGKVVGGLGTTPYLDQLSQILSHEIGLAGSRIFYALDGTGAVALSSDASQIMAQNIKLADNVERQTSPITGWRFALGYPAGE